MLRSCVKFIGAAGSPWLVGRLQVECEGSRSQDQFTYYPDKGFPKRFTPNVPARPKPMPFVLLGVGKFDALPGCVAGLAVGPSTLSRAKKWIKEERSGNGSSFSFVEHLLSKENIITPHSISNPVKVGVTLRANSPFTTRQLVRVLDRFLPSHGHDVLLDRIEGALGRNATLEVGEELSFYWFDNDDLYILHDGELYDIIHMPYMSRSFLQLFVGPEENIVSRELYRSITNRLPDIDDL